MLVRSCIPRITVMGARIIARPDLRAAKGKDSHVIALIIAAVVGPLLLTYLFIAADMRSDLSGLRLQQTTSGDGAVLVSWKDLETNDERGRQRDRDLPNGPARMLGYMMDGYRPARDGTQIEMFMLMPEAGQLLHPAHRLPDEMVEVWLAGGQTIPYLDRQLVWVEGILQRIRQKPREGLAFYGIRGATVEHASERDITRWFTP
jgi:hypothetical protein